MSTPIFDRSALKTKPLAQRIHDLSRDAVLDLGAPVTFEHVEEFRNVAGSMIRAKEKGDGQYASLHMWLSAPNPEEQCLCAPHMWRDLNQETLFSYGDFN